MQKRLNGSMSAESYKNQKIKRKSKGTVPFDLPFDLYSFVQKTKLCVDPKLQNGPSCAKS
jgi:hypothetical protein